MVRAFPSYVSKVVRQVGRVTGPDPSNKPVSYEVVLKQMKEVLSAIDIEVDVSNFGTHSNRSGSATYAFRSGKVSEMEVQSSGRWAAEKTPRQYIHLEESQKS